MLKTTGPSSHNCHAVSRRSFLRIGALGLAGFTLPDLLRARAATPAASDTAAILIWCNGGPTQFETYDPKPDAPEDYRGPFAPIATNVTGMQICEVLPKHAKLADRFALVRSCAHNVSSHGSATKNLMTGYLH